MQCDAHCYIKLRLVDLWLLYARSTVYPFTFGGQMDRSRSFLLVRLDCAKTDDGRQADAPSNYDEQREGRPEGRPVAVDSDGVYIWRQRDEVVERLANALNQLVVSAASQLLI